MTPSVLSLLDFHDRYVSLAQSQKLLMLRNYYRLKNDYLG